MRSILTLAALALAPTLAFAQSAKPPAAPAPPPSWPATVAAIVRQMQLTRGERVLMVAEPGQADAIVAPLRAAIKAAGATDLGVIAVRGKAPAAWGTDFTRGAEGKDAEQLVSYLGVVDLGIMLPGAAPTDPAYDALQRILRAAPNATPVRGVRTVHFHWAGAYSLAGELMTTAPAYAALYQRVLEQTDYVALAKAQRDFESAMRAAPVRVTTPAGTDLTFRIGERVVTKQDGDASAAHAKGGKVLIDREVELPAGAIRVAPIEESVNGTIAFPDGTWGGVAVKGLVMTFAKGKLTTFTALAGKEGVDKELAAAGTAGRSFREFALGFNPLLVIPDKGERWIPYYGYGAGVVRLSLGDNSELGGKVTGGYVRWNFFTDATVRVGTRVWVDAGKMK